MTQSKVIFKCICRRFFSPLDPETSGVISWQGRQGERDRITFSPGLALLWPFTPNLAPLPLQALSRKGSLSAVGGLFGA